MKRKLKKLFTVFFIILIPSFSFSQNDPGNSWLKFSGDYSYSKENYMTRYIVSCEILEDHWCGVEVGVSARLIRGAEPDLNYFTVPIFWKIQTKYINIALGLDLSFRLNGERKDEDEKDDDDGADYLAIAEALLDSGLVLKVGFPISITKKFVIEPELSLNVYTSFYLGLGVSFKIPI